MNVMMDVVNLRRHRSTRDAREFKPFPKSGTNCPKKKSGLQWMLRLMLLICVNIAPLTPALRAGARFARDKAYVIKWSFG